MCRSNIAVFVVLAFALFSTCKKAENNNTSSIKIIETTNEPKQVGMVSSQNGNLLVCITSGTLSLPVVKQELILLNPSGEVIKHTALSDTIYQFMSVVPGVNGGYFICASSNAVPYISLFSLDDNANMVWSKNIAVTFGTNLNAPALTIGHDNNYLIMFQSYGSGYYINKTSPSGTEIYNKKIPPPGYIHQGPGLNFGEKYVRFYQPNDSMIVIQGVTFDGYSQVVENCFIRALTDNVTQKWFSTNFDSLYYESGGGLITNNNNEIVLIVNKANDQNLEGFGDVFARRFSLDNSSTSEFNFPRIGGTPNNINKVINSPDGGYLMVGSNNQLSANDLVSPNKIILVKLNTDLSVSWSNSINTYYPAKGQDAAYLMDGSIALSGLLKDNLSENKLMYMHLDAFGNLINN